MQFYIRRLVYSEAPSLPTAFQNVVPLIGPLPISLNTRECVLLIFHEIFADLYTFLFRRKAKLAKKPKAWQISLLFEASMEDGYLLETQYYQSLTKARMSSILVNLIDNYVPLVLSIYSIVFKCNNYDQYYQSLLHSWIMCIVFRRRHYNKALLIMLSLFHRWEDDAHSIFETLHHNLVAFGEYPVENFHSILPARTNENDSADQIASDCRFIYSAKGNNMLKSKAAELLANKFESINKHPNHYEVIFPSKLNYKFCARTLYFDT